MEAFLIEATVSTGIANLTEAVVSDVQARLKSTPKSLSPWLFYDDAGSELFDKITQLPEYYVSRLERQILTENALAIVKHVQGLSRLPFRIVELGAGSAEKTSTLLARAQAVSTEVHYVPIDISLSALDVARRNLESALPHVRVAPVHADYVTNPIELEPFPGSTLALYIGSSIGNFEPSDARRILRSVRKQLGPNDMLLLGTDLVKREGILVQAYDDSQGVTALFNRNVLRRLNRELQANFQEDCFAHRAIWNGQSSRIEMHLESLRDQQVDLPLAGISVSFSAGETIHTENSYKYTPESIRALLSDSGFTAQHQFTDEASWYAVTLARPSNEVDRSR